jgi:hypothetical protein
MEIISGLVANASDGEYVSMVWRGFQKFTGRTGLTLFLFAIVDYICITPNLKSRFQALLHNRSDLPQV